MAKHRAIILIVALAIGVIGIYATVQYTSLGVRLVSAVRGVSVDTLPGTLVFETGSIVVADDTQTHEFVSFIPDAAATPFPMPGLLAPDRSSGVAARYSQGFIEIVRFSSTMIEPMRPLAKHMLQTVTPFNHVNHPVWSPDSRSVAYLFSPPIPESLIAPDGEPFVTLDPSGGVGLRNTALLPREYSASIFVASEGQEPRRLVPGIPVSFSSSGNHLLIRNGTALSLISVDTGELSTISGAPSLQVENTLTAQVRSVPGGNYLVIWIPAKQATVYSINWANASLSELGALSDVETIQDLIFDSSTGNQLLTLTVRKKERRFDVYRIGDQIVRTASYKANLPEDALLLQWFSQQ